MLNLLPKFKIKYILTFVSVCTLVLAVGQLGLFGLPKVFATAGINAQINFQGKLVDSSGLNVSDGSKTVIFSIYNVSSGGTALWTETQSVTTADGIFRASLGSVTPIPSNFNFNWDGMYLGIKVGADSEMTPRIRMAAVPYAFNAQKVAGLTVQDTSGNASTSGILQVANGKTVTFGDAFSTTVGNSLAFTTTGTTALTLPTTGTLTTLAGAETLVNKIIGSSGLTFTGATTDITTGTNEDFVLSPSGTGNIGLFTTTVQAKLHLNATTNSKGAFLITGDGNQPLFSASVSGVTKFVVDKVGNVGIGITNPTSELYAKYFAANSTASTPVLTLDNPSGGTQTSMAFKFNGSTKGLIAVDSGGSFYLSPGNSGTTYLGYTSLGTPGGVNFLNGAVTIANSGNIVGSGTLTGITGLTLASGGINVGGTVGTGSQCLLGGASASWGSCGTSSQWTTVSSDIYFNTGNVAIGTTIPTSYKLLVVGGASSFAGIETSGTSSFSNSNAGGDASPLYIRNSGNTNNTAVSFRLQSYNSAWSFKDSGIIRATMVDATSTTEGSSLSFLNMIGGTLTESLRISETGNIGIGTTTSLSSKLVVNGGANIAGSLTGLTGLTLASGGINVGGTVGTGSQCLLGGASASWGSCGGGGASYWQNVNAGVISPFINTTDVLIGSTATSSALIRLAGTSGENSFFKGGNVGIGTTNPQTLLNLASTGTLRVGRQASGESEVSITAGNIVNTYDITDSRFALFSNGTTEVGFPGGYDAGALRLGTGGNYTAISGGGTGLGQLSFWTGNDFTAPKAFLTAAGNLGIGTTTPTKMLQVTEDAKINNIGIVDSGSSNSTIQGDGYITISPANALSINNLSGGAVVFYADTVAATRGVGIGTTAPLTTLHVNGQGSRGRAALIVDQTASSNNDIFTASASGITRFVISNAGNVGIGTTTTSIAKLQVSGSIGITAGNYFISTTDTGNRLSLHDGVTGRLALFSAGSERFTIGYDGNIGIGSTAPLGLFNVDGAATGKALAIFNQNGGNQAVLTASISGVTKFVVTSAGNVGIGMTTAAKQLEVNGDIQITNSGTSTLYFNSGNSSGNVWSYLVGGDQFLIQRNGVDKLVFNSAGDMVVKGNINNNVVSAAMTLGASGASSTLSLLAGGSTSRIRIASNGNVGIGTTVTSAALLTIAGDISATGTLTGLTGLTLASGPITLGASTGSGQCITGGASATWGSCGSGGSGTNYLGQANGLTYVGNLTTDFAIGGTSTGSAKFIFGGMNSGTPTATFSGDLIIGERPNTAATDMQKWTKITGTAGTVGGGTAGVASISASVVYNGSLYVGTNNANNAEIYRYDGDGAGTWTKVSGTAGTVGGNATTGIDMISSLIVYNGYLYAGTTETDKAEIYRYSGGSNWNSLNAGGVAGKLATTTLIDGVPSMVVFGGRLFAGTKEGAKAEVYMSYGIAWAAINSTAGTFVTTNTAAVDAVTQMVVINNQLIIATQKTGDADVLRWNGIVGGSPFFALNLASTTGSYLIDNIATTGVNEVTSMTVWAGKLIVAFRRGAGLADVIMYQQPPSGAAPINSWTHLNGASGTLGTSGIDSVTAMTVYGGRLYVGTTKLNGAEVYRYDEGISWTRVSQNTQGRIAAGGTSSIDGIATLISFNHNSLFAGTWEGTSAEGYSYNVAIDQSYALKFNAGASQGGGEQNNNLNLAQIFFVASLSANVNNKAGNTGAFVFSHSIVTNNGSYDVAEDYPTRDDTLEPGDIVSIDPNERGFVKKSEGEYDYTAIGIYSESPGLRLSQDEVEMNGGRAIPIALAGRAPVKVNTENGEIKNGDPLTPSSTPGVAMKAKKSGLIIGQALESYNGDGVGKVQAYIKSTTYQGSIAESFVNLDPKDTSFGSGVLSALASQSTNGHSEVVTDTLIAGLQVVTQHATAHEVSVNTISIATGSALAVKLGSDGKVTFGENEDTGIVFDSHGNAKFSGTITAKSIKAESIEGMEIITGKISLLSQVLATVSANLSQTGTIPPPPSVLAAETVNPAISSDMLINSLGVTGIATISGDFRVKGSGLVEGVLSVVDTLTTNNFIVNGISTFFDTVVFKKDVEFAGHQTVGNDSAGLARIKKGESSVDITFEKEYASLPIINANLIADKVDNEEDQKQSDELLLSQQTTFVIVHRTKKGFTLLLKKAAFDDLQFSWTAVMVKNPELFTSDIAPKPFPH